MLPARERQGSGKKPVQTEDNFWQEKTGNKEKKETDFSVAKRGIGTVKKRAVRWKILVPIMIGILVMTAAFILISYVSFRDYEMDDCKLYCQGLTSLIAHEIIKPNDVEGYLRMGKSFPGYRATEEKLYQLRDAYPDVVYLYAYQFQADGIHVVFDLDTEQFRGSDPGTVEHYATDLKPYVPKLIAGEEVPPIISRDTYGYVLTILTPVYDANGVCKCYIGADCSMDALSDYVMKLIWRILHFYMIILVIAVIAGVILTNSEFRKMKRLENRAYIDTLTGLQNRTAFYENMGGLTKKIKTGTADFSTLMIDVNYLKKVNDVYGHEQGNAYLQGAANLIRKHFGDEGIYRIGGDEFAMILEGKAQDGIEEKISAFREEMARLQADDSLQPWEKPSAAVGLARYSKDEHEDPDAVLRKADELMYADKVAMKAVRTD